MIERDYLLGSNHMLMKQQQMYITENCLCAQSVYTQRSRSSENQ